jgi:hypothetical protein
MKNLKYFTTTLMALTAMFALSACDGKGEDAGEKVDEMVTDAGNAVEDACEDVKDAADAKDKDC